MYIKLLLSVLLFLVSGQVLAQVFIIPQPAKVSVPDGLTGFPIDKSSVILFTDKKLEPLAKYLSEQIKIETGIAVPYKKGIVASGIVLDIDDKQNPKEGAYALDVFNTQVYMGAANTQGVFYAVQSFLQMLHQAGASRLVPAVKIEDEPRFSYRGMHLDVSRHFFSVAFVKQYIDYLAAYKFNTFHWHLTDDQGWRIEIKKYPKLQEVGAYRAGTIIGKFPGTGNDNIKYGGYYTQEEIKEVVAYAKNKYVTIIPEIEMPGHSAAALASYPFLGCTKGPYKVFETWGVIEDVFCAGQDTTFAFLQDVIDEVAALFPSKYIHIGGDECPKERWKACTACQAKIKAEGLKDEHELQSYFIKRMERYINSKGKQIIGWDEILEGGLAPNATVMSWRGETGGIEAAKQNHNVIMTPGKPVYFDHSQSRNEDSLTIGGLNTLEAVYAYEPVPKELSEKEATFVLGAQANVWTEYMASPSKIEYQIFPRILALSEVLWSKKENKNWAAFETKLPMFLNFLKQKNISFSNAYYDINAKALPTKGYNGVLWELNSKDKSGIQVNALDSFWKYQQAVFINQSGSYYAQNQNRAITQQFSFNKATGKSINITPEPSARYPGNGAFTLVDGIQNTKGFSKSYEFIGFNGNDVKVVIDLGEVKDISSITVHSLHYPSAWIYRHSKINATISYKEVSAGVNAVVQNKEISVSTTGNKISLGKQVKAQKIELEIKNYGLIPSPFDGAGNKAWLFLSEIEVE